MFNLMDCIIDDCDNKSRPYVLTCGNHSVEEQLDAMGIES